MIQVPLELGVMLAVGLFFLGYGVCANILWRTTLKRDKLFFEKQYDRAHEQARAEVRRFLPAGSELPLGPGDGPEWLRLRRLERIHDAANHLLLRQEDDGNLTVVSGYGELVDALRAYHGWVTVPRTPTPAEKVHKFLETLDDASRS